MGTELHSKDFLQFVKAIGESRSKQEEDRILLSEIQTLKKCFTAPDLSAFQVKEYLVRAIYIEMLGYKAPFAYIHAIKLTQTRNLLCKKVGYLFCSLFLNSQQELLLLLINSLQKDLQSSNYMEVDAALSCLCKLLNKDIISVVLPSVLSLTKHHPKVSIKKKSCMVLYCIYQHQPTLLETQLPEFIRGALCDSNLSVIGAALHLFELLIQENKNSYKDLVPTLVCILRQILDNRVSHDYDYYFISAPWIQIKLLSLLGILGEGDQVASDEIQETLLHVFRKADLKVNASFAIVYQAVKTTTAILSLSNVVEAASTIVSKFITSENQNLKYIEDSDETLKKKTLDLLYRMTNPKNSMAIIDKLLSYLTLPVERSFYKDLIYKICSLAERFAPNQLWYVTTLNKVWMIGGDVVPQNSAHNLLRLVAEGPTGLDHQDNLFRQQTVNIYIQLLNEHSVLPDILVKTSVWILGEYGSLNTTVGYENLESLIHLVQNCLTLRTIKETTKSWIFSSIFKLCIARLIALVTHAGKEDSLILTASYNSWSEKEKVVWPPRDSRLIPCVVSLLKDYSSTTSLMLKQRCVEFQYLVMTPEPGEPFDTIFLLKELYPFDGACEDIHVDIKLSFLNAYVESCLLKGSLPCPIEQEKDSCYPKNNQNNSRTVNATKLSNTVQYFSKIECQSSHFAEKDPCLTPYPSEKDYFNDAIKQIDLPSRDKHESALKSHYPEEKLLVRGPSVWGPSGYEAKSSCNEATKQKTSTTQKASYHYVLPETNVSTLSHNTLMDSEKQKAAQELFCGFDSNSKLDETNTLTFSPLTSENSLHYKKDLTTSPTFLTNVSQQETDKNDWLNGTMVDPTKNPSSKPQEQIIHGLLLDSDDLIHPSHVPCESISTLPLKKAIEPVYPTKLLSLLSPMEISIDQVEITWSTLPYEKKRRMLTNIKNASDLLTSLQKILPVAIVQSIAEEAILAAQDTSNTSSFVYIHVKLIPADAIEFIFRASQQQMIEGLPDEIFQCLSFHTIINESLRPSS
ncbi:uncharacterized protein LOC128883185 isoform X2 [Hylaeus volcanicus]|uniref:uncharacterized protein LOC128883185 isoform X2 n=1 Tax=Hylaeus volcanicus TaxID=313075 RepID=UPI0023B789C9|nr:uncharacterized protein LOC128883185 isoform X2 [Hylaeus volcanicus]